MKIVIAPDSFKGNLTALEVANNIEKGIKKNIPEAKIKKIPMADGGEGTVQALVDATDGKIIKKEVTGPLGKKVKAEFGLLGDGKTAVIEMAKASGLPLISEKEANPLLTTTYGTGELIQVALDQGIDKLIIGIGGSATNDAGVGMAQALGVNFYDENNEEIGFGGKELKRIETIEVSNLDVRIKKVDIEVACDVDNPLYGKNGAAYVYAPQKGANQKMVEKLDKNLRYFSNIIKKELNIEVQSIPGAGAAGGLGAGLVAFLDANLKSGINIVLEIYNLEEKLKDTDLVITGEGKIDGQTINGKVPVGVAKEAKKYDIPVVALCGEIGKDVEKVFENNIDCVFTAVHKAVPLKEAMQLAPQWLQFSGEQIIRLILLNK